ncbi:hypothetical protein ACP4OV_006381 [Aristida adscensionis]
MPAAAATAAALVAAAASSVAAAQPPEPRGNSTSSVANVLSISVFMAIFFPVFVVFLAFACLRLFSPPYEAADASPSASERSRRGGRSGGGGLDAAAIAALPLVFYREVKRHRILGGRGEPDDALECSVCLLEFDDDDALRLLPTCPHAFHPECIGLWLEKHATCPLCRASLLDAPPPVVPPPPQPSPPPETAPQQPAAAVVVGVAGDNGEAEDWTTIQSLARNRRAAGRQALPRSNSTGHDGAAGGGGGGGTERFELRLPEHVRLEILMSHRLRHVTSAVASVRVREGSAHGATVAGSVRSAVSRLLSLLAPADGDDRSGKAADAAASSLRHRENSSRGGVGEEKRSV